VRWLVSRTASEWGYLHGHLLSQGVSIDGLSGRDLLDLTYALTVEGQMSGASQVQDALDKHMLTAWTDRETWGAATPAPSIPPAPLRVRKDEDDAPR
jgi:hypothetical protein